MQTNSRPFYIKLNILNIRRIPPDIARGPHFMHNLMIKNRDLRSPTEGSFSPAETEDPSLFCKGVLAPALCGGIGHHPHHWLCKEKNPGIRKELRHSM